MEQVLIIVAAFYHREKKFLEGEPPNIYFSIYARQLLNFKGTAFLFAISHFSHAIKNWLCFRAYNSPRTVFENVNFDYFNH